MGLGLVISKMIVTEFHGDIDLTTEFGKGSSFFFSFEIMEFLG
jgi:signal transduction histidine kinase